MYPGSTILFNLALPHSLFKTTLDPAYLHFLRPQATSLAAVIPFSLDLVDLSTWQLQPV